MTRFGRGTSEAHQHKITRKESHETLGRDIPGCPPDATPSPHVFWRVPATGAYNCIIYTFFFFKNNAALRNYFANLHTIGWGGPPTLPAQRACSSESSACTSTASSGSPGSSGVNIKWSSQSLTTGRPRRGAAHRPLWMPTPAIVFVAPSPVWPRPISVSRRLAALRGLTPPIPPPPCARPPQAHHAPPASACPLPPRRSCQSRPGGSGPSGLWCGLPLGGHGAQNLPMWQPVSPPPSWDRWPPAGRDPLHLVPGGIVCQDTPFKYEGTRCA